MKKLIILSMILVLGLSLVAYTEAVKLNFLYFPAINNNVAEGCFVIVNSTPDDDVTATIQIHVIGLDPKTLYEVWSRVYMLGTFVTNKLGHGKLHCNLPLGDFADEGDLGRRIRIRLEDYGDVKLASEKLPLP